MAFKLVLRGSDYFLKIMDSAVVTYIMVFNFVSASLFKTTTGEGDPYEKCIPRDTKEK